MPGWKCYLGHWDLLGRYKEHVFKGTPRLSLLSSLPSQYQVRCFSSLCTPCHDNAASSKSPSEGAQRPRSLKPWAQITVSPFKLYISGILSQGWNLTNTGLRWENKADRDEESIYQPYRTQAISHYVHVSPTPPYTCHQTQHQVQRALFRWVPFTFISYSYHKLQTVLLLLTLST